MMTKKAVSGAINGIYLMMIVLLLLDEATSFDIKNQFLKSFVYTGLLFATPVALIWNVAFAASDHKKIIRMLLPMLTLSLVLYVGPLKFSFASGAWHTQTVLYQNNRSVYKKIEFQMQDVGALGYNQRSVEVIYLTKLFMITSAIPQNVDQRPEWTKVDEDANELKLKFP